MAEISFEIILKPEETIFREIDAFIFEHADGNIFQTSQYFNVFYKSQLNKPCFIISRNQLRKINGLVLFVIQYQLKTPLAYFTSRSLIIGGPIIEEDNPEIYRSIIEYYDQFIGRKVIYSQVRNLKNAATFKNFFIEYGYYYEDHLNILVDLTKSEEQLWKEMHSKRRNEIKRAEKELLDVKLIGNNADFYESYKVLKALYRQIGLPLYEKDIFLNIFNRTNKEGFFKFFGVYFEEKLIGTMYTFCFKSVVYNWFAGSYERFYKKYPNDLLPWKVFLWGKENGFSTFDWGGAGKPGVEYGVRDYKAKFGGEFVNYGRYEKIHNKSVFKIVSIGFKTLRYIRKKLHF